MKKYSSVLPFPERKIKLSSDKRKNKTTANPLSSPLLEVKISKK